MSNPTVESLLPPSSATGSDNPLCVDLDGTLVKSDTLVDSCFLLVRTNPLFLFKALLWLRNGKAGFKDRITSSVELDVVHLPYNQPLLEFLKRERGKGRAIYLATGADVRLAQRIADHLGIFDGVLASDGQTNLIGNNKLERLRNRFDGGRFDYIGNALPDVPLLAGAGVAMVANPDRDLRQQLKRRNIPVKHSFEDRAPFVSSLRKAVRVHQWAKNVLIFLPLMLAHATRIQDLLDTAVAFFCFCLCASSTYVINDLLDIQADRGHLKKRHRPFAAGNLSAMTGLEIVVLFLAMAFIGAFYLPRAFAGWMITYMVVTLAYSLVLKKIVLVDVLVLSGLYTIRILAGASATAVPISTWLSTFSIFIFLSLAIVKRFAELQNKRDSGTTHSTGRGYLLIDIEQMRSFGTSSAYAAVVVFSLYISSLRDGPLYTHPNRMWLIVPLMILWISRVWLLASRGQLDEDPVVFAMTNKMSLLIGIAVVTVVALAM
jgi:4-hydroxybenzoate polyprenyltransferase